MEIMMNGSFEFKKYKYKFIVRNKVRWQKWFMRCYYHYSTTTCVAWTVCILFRSSTQKLRKFENRLCFQLQCYCYTNKKSAYLSSSDCTTLPVTHPRSFVASCLCHACYILLVRMLNTIGHRIKHRKMATESS